MAWDGEVGETGTGDEKANKLGNVVKEEDEDEDDWVTMLKWLSGWMLDDDDVTDIGKVMSGRLFRELICEDEVEFVCGLDIFILKLK